MDLKSLNRKYDSPFVGKRSRVTRMFLFKERKFLRMLFILFLITGALYPYPYIAMWVGFAFAGYSAIANDSIQTIGTFLSSNADRRWWALWLFLGGIFVAVMTIGWIVNGGDVSFGRLQSKGFDQQAESFRYLQVAAPLVLLFLTRLRMPVSTTFLLLSAFSASSSGIFGVLTKSLSGYIIAFISAITIWFLLSKQIKKFVKGKYHPGWRVFQWMISGLLWSVWLMQDAANIAVFLPRSLSLWQFIAFVSYIFFGLGFLLYFRGGRIQNIINEKSDVKEIKGATVIDLVYALVLLIFYYWSKVPMSTTWVFLGLLAGRELAMKLAPAYKTKRSLKKILKLIRKDATNAFIGLIISIILAILVNPLIQKEILEAVGIIK
ncbi:MAG: hypothetical protein LAT54_04470 [Cryomorphaceae bacterium]|nr:hypothetical protein [Cryomorphaceae bacterium]